MAAVWLSPEKTGDQCKLISVKGMLAADLLHIKAQTDLLPTCIQFIHISKQTTCDLTTSTVADPFDRSRNVFIPSP